MQAVKQYGGDRHENAGYLNEEFMCRPTGRQLDAVLAGGDPLYFPFGYSPSASSSSGRYRGVTTPLARAEGRVLPGDGALGFGGTLAWGGVLAWGSAPACGGVP